MERRSEPAVFVYRSAAHAAGGYGLPGGRAHTRRPAEPEQVTGASTAGTRQVPNPDHPEVIMIYRMRIYQAVPAHLPAFHDFFLEHLLPVQERHGARLVGRWQTEDHRVVAVWEYDDQDAYHRIQAAVRADPDTAASQQHRYSLPLLFTHKEEVFMASTLAPPNYSMR